MPVHVRPGVVAKSSSHHADLRLDRVSAREHYDDVVAKARDAALGFGVAAPPGTDAAHREARAFREIDHAAQQFDIVHAGSIVQPRPVGPRSAR